MVERLKVNQFHTTPSAIRRLMKSGDKYVKNYDLSSLKTIGSGMCMISGRKSFKTHMRMYRHLHGSIDLHTHASYSFVVRASMWS